MISNGVNNIFTYYHNGKYTLLKKSTFRQWNVTKNLYSSTALKYKFEELYWSISILCNYFYSTTYQRIILYFFVTALVTSYCSDYSFSNPFCPEIPPNLVILDKLKCSFKKKKKMLWIHLAYNSSISIHIKAAVILIHKHHVKLTDLLLFFMR